MGLLGCMCKDSMVGASTMGDCNSQDTDVSGK